MMVFPERDVQQDAQLIFFGFLLLFKILLTSKETNNNCWGDMQAFSVAKLDKDYHRGEIKLHQTKFFKSFKLNNFPYETRKSNS